MIPVCMISGFFPWVSIMIVCSIISFLFMCICYHRLKDWWRKYKDVEQKDFDK